MKNVTWAIVLIVWFTLIVFSVATNPDLNKIDKRSLAGSMLGELLLIVILAWIVEIIVRFVYEKMPRFKVKTSQLGGTELFFAATLTIHHERR